MVYMESHTVIVCYLLQYIPAFDRFSLGTRSLSHFEKIGDAQMYVPLHVFLVFILYFAVK
jgi:hypothetical protein